jgi:hypothetical protein
MHAQTSAAPTNDTVLIGSLLRRSRRSDLTG